MRWFPWTVCCSLLLGCGAEDGSTGAGGAAGGSVGGSGAQTSTGGHEAGNHAGGQGGGVSSGGTGGQGGEVSSGGTGGEVVLGGAGGTGGSVGTGGGGASGGFGGSGGSGGAGPACHDDTIEGDEICDNAELGGEDCVSQGFLGGELACNETCDGFDTAGCYGVPAGWTCDPSYYFAADGCDCGCGAVDRDCLDATAASCTYCAQAGSCGATEECPGNIDPDDNSKCTCDGTPDGGTEERPCYDAAEVPYGESCTSSTQSRACNNGTWGEWPACDALACSPAPPADCGAVPHGGSEQRTCYDAATVPYGESCTGATQSHTCDNGTWTDWPSCDYLTCTMDPGSCQGTPLPCTSATGSCSSLQGCYEASPPTCTGTATNCGALSAPTPCSSQSGCSSQASYDYCAGTSAGACGEYQWSGATMCAAVGCTYIDSWPPQCVGTTWGCAGLSEVVCMYAYGDCNPSYDYACVGTVTECATLPGGSSCTAQQGCSTVLHCDGTPSACASFGTIETCSAQAGCLWQ